MLLSRKNIIFNKMFLNRR